MLTASFHYTAQRWTADGLQRAIYEGAQQYGVTATVRRVAGWWDHSDYWTLTGPDAAVRELSGRITATLRRMYDEDRR